MTDELEFVQLPVPTRNTSAARVTPALKGLVVNLDQAIRLTPPACRALRQYGYRNKWRLRTQTQTDGSILVWRVA